MSDPISRAIRLSRSNLPAFAALTMTAAGLAGWASMAYVEKNGKSASDGDVGRGEMSRDEALVRAMVENARVSTWRENLNNMYEAQERFVLPGRARGGRPEFMDRVVERGEEIAAERREEMEREGRGRGGAGDREVFETWGR